MKTLLIGNFGDYNLGDELILLAALKDYPGAIVMTSDPNFSQTFTETEFKTVPFPPTGLRSWWQFLTDRDYSQALLKLKLRGIDQVVFAGGGLFAIKWRACFLWWCVFQFIKKSFPQAEVKFEHQGVDKDLGILSRGLARRVFKAADTISVRDVASGAALAAIGIENYEVKQDRVRDYLVKSEQGAVISKQQTANSEQLLLINAIKPFDVSVIEKKYQKHRIVFVPFALSDMGILPDDFGHEIFFPETKTELFNILIEAEIVIGERFHSIVCGAHFCGAENTFTLREPYSEKVTSFCELNNITPVFPALK